MKKLLTLLILLILPITILTTQEIYAFSLPNANSGIIAENANNIFKSYGPTSEYGIYEYYFYSTPQNAYYNDLGTLASELIGFDERNRIYAMRSDVNLDIFINNTYYGETTNINFIYVSNGIYEGAFRPIIYFIDKDGNTAEVIATEDYLVGGNMPSIKIEFLILIYDYEFFNLAYNQAYNDAYENAYTNLQEEFYPIWYEDGRVFGYSQARLEFGHYNTTTSTFETATVYGNKEYLRGLSSSNTESYEQGKIDGQNEVFYADFDKWIVPAIIVTLVLGGFIFIKNKRNEM